MTAALYATIWMALLLFVAGAAGAGRLAGRGQARGWARPAWLAGALLAIVHMLLALGSRYGWQHDVAVQDTAQQAAEVYGTAWRGSLYMNYIFVSAWLLQGWRWQTLMVAPPQGVTVMQWALRLFYLVIIVNGAIVFASPIGRILGVAVVGALVCAWWPQGGGSRQAFGFRRKIAESRKRPELISTSKFRA